MLEGRGLGRAGQVTVRPLIQEGGDWGWAQRSERGPRSHLRAGLAGEKEGLNFMYDGAGR